jgi:exonuclease III
MGDLNIPRTDLDASRVRTWSTSEEDFTPNRSLLEIAIATIEGIDADQDGHTLTWFPQPNKIMQRRHIGMRIDYIIYDKRLTCEQYSVQSLLGGSDHRPVTALLSNDKKSLPLEVHLPIARLASICPSAKIPLVKRR